MQPQDSATVTRRALDFTDYMDIVRRHRGWILGPTLACLVVSVVAAYLWPDTYVSTAVIRIIPPQVPENLVATNLNMSMQARLTSMTEVILSRATLTNIISTLGLYKKDLTRMPMDDVVENMRTKDIKISQPQASQTANPNSVTAFQIGFSYDNRFQAQKVTNELVSRFITENLRDRTDESAGTTQFLGNELEQAKKRLDDAEQKLSDFRSRNMGRLPDQMEANMQALNSLQVQLTSVSAGISRVSQDKLLIENQIRILKDQLKVSEDNSKKTQTLGAANDKLAQADREIAALENNLGLLRERYKETYPDVQGAEALLAQVRKNREAILAEMANTKPETKVVLDPQSAHEIRELGVSIQHAESQLAGKDLEMQQLQKSFNQVTESMRGYQGRIESLPVGEKEYSQLGADVDLARRAWAEMNVKYSSSQIATNLENRRQGETLELLDPASLPQTPAKPQRLIIISVGLGLGVAFGLLVGGIREIKDASLKNLKDVRAYTQLPILGSIPLLENDLVVRRRRRLSWMAWSTACLVGVLIMSGSIVYYYATRV